MSVCVCAFAIVWGRASVRARVYACTCAWRVRVRDCVPSIFYLRLLFFSASPRDPLRPPTRPPPAHAPTPHSSVSSYRLASNVTAQEALGRRVDIFQQTRVKPARAALSLLRRRSCSHPFVTDQSSYRFGGRIRSLVGLYHPSLPPSLSIEIL